MKSLTLEMVFNSHQWLEPYGITAGIIPWNYPLMFIGWKVIISEFFKQ
jgi:acyl-CoA reductase-like NAD-dependent aldehyde dehydrogenase